MLMLQCILLRKHSLRLWAERDHGARMPIEYAWSGLCRTSAVVPGTGGARCHVTASARAGLQRSAQLLNQLVSCVAVRELC